MAKTQNKRIKNKARQRARITRAWVIRNRAALKIVMPGVATQQAYGHVVNGASATQTHDMRVNLKGATHLGGTQACITTSLAWLFGPTADSAGFGCNRKKRNKTDVGNSGRKDFEGRES